MSIDLFLKPQQHLYALLDSARDREVARVASEYPDKCLNLYNGETAQELQGVSPYLFDCSDHDVFHSIRKFWGNNCGIFLQTKATIEQTKAHFRRFVMVTLPGERKAYFRFYDPRVIRPFLNSADPQQLEAFFGPIATILVEVEDSQDLFEYKQQHGRLSTLRFSRSKQKTLQSADTSR